MPPVIISKTSDYSMHVASTKQFVGDKKVLRVLRNSMLLSHLFFYGIHGHMSCATGCFLWWFCGFVLCCFGVWWLVWCCFGCLVFCFFLWIATCMVTPSYSTKVTCAEPTHFFFHEYGRRVGMVPRSSLKEGKNNQMVEKRTRTIKPTKTKQTTAHRPRLHHLAVFPNK